MVLILLILAVFLLSPVTVYGQTINEFLAHPSTGNDEWVEFHNPSNIDLTIYWLDDDTSFADDSGSSAKKALTNLNTTNNIYPYLEFGSFLNNSGDYVVLFSSNGTIVDQYQYTSDPGTDVSIGRSPDGSTWATLSSASKGSTNGSVASTPTPFPSPSSNPSSSSSSTSTSFSNSFTISNIPSKIDSTETFTANINLSLPNSVNTALYLKGAFKKKEGSNYFGLTKVGSNWIKNNQTYSDQYKITTNSSGVWSGNLEIQPDILDSGYEGSGDYIFKVGRYTDSGSLSWSNEVNINIMAQEIITKDENPEVLGTSQKKEEKKEKTPTVDKISLEKYVKISTPASSTAVSSPTTEVKGEGQINIFSVFGMILVIIGAGVFGYAIYNSYRKRNQGFG